MSELRRMGRLKGVKVAVACETVPPGFAGAGPRSVSQAQFLASHGVAASLVTTTAEAVGVHGLPVTVVPASRGLQARGTGGYLTKGWRAGSIFAAARRAFELDRPDLLHLVGFYPWAAVVGWAAASLGIPYVVESTLMGADDALTIRNSPDAFVRYTLMERANALVCISPRFDEAADSTTIPREMRRIVANAVDPHRIRPATAAERQANRAALGIDAPGLLVLHLGALVERKGQEAIVRAFAQVASRDRTAHLALVGPRVEDDDGYARRVEEVIDELGLQSRVSIPGRTNRVPNWMMAADIFCFYSEAEGLPNAVLEAMAAGLPVVARRLPGITDYLFERDGGLEVDSGQELGERLVGLVENAELRATLGDRARADVLDRFSPTSVMQGYVDLYLDVLAHSAGASWWNEPPESPAGESQDCAS